MNSGPKLFTVQALTPTSCPQRPEPRHPTAAISTTPYTGYSFTAAGDLRTLRSPNEDVTTYGYDHLHRLQSEAVTIRNAAGAPETVTRTYRLDLNGNLLQKTDRLGRVVKYTHDRLDRACSEEWVRADGTSDGYKASFSHYVDGSVKEASDARNASAISKYEFEYDVLGRTDKVNQVPAATLPGQSYLFDYTYDAVGRLGGRLVRTSGNPVFETTYGYDRLDRLDWIGQSGSAVRPTGVDFVYNDNDPTDASYRRLQHIYRRQEGAQVSHTQFTYDQQKRLEVIYHYAAPDSVSTYSYGYDEDNRINRIVPTVQGQPRPLEIQNFPEYDARGQLLQASNASGSEQESFAYDENGNRLGQTDPHDRLRDDAAHRLEYDKEGNVQWRWFLEDAQLGLAIDDDNVIDTGSGLVYGTSLWLESGEKPLSPSWYRLRVPPLTITADTNPGEIKVTVQVYKDDSFVFQDTKLTEKSATGTLKATGEPNKFLAPALVWDWYLGNDEPEVYLKVGIEFPSAPQPVGKIALAGHVYVDRFTGLQKHEWDYRQRLVRTWDYGAPHSATGCNPAAADGCTPIRQFEFLYDVLDQLIGRRQYDGSGAVLENARYYINEAGRPLLDFDQQQRPERRYLYAAAVDQLLAVEDWDYNPDGSVALDEIIWTLTDHQGTIRDLLAAGKPAEHVSYDPFGRRYGDASGWLASEISAGYRGLSFDLGTEFYWDGVRPYDPASGRYLSEDPAGHLGGGGTNLYEFSGNTPVARDAAGPTGFGGATAPSFWGAFSEDPNGQRVLGGLQTLGGVGQIAGGVGLCATIVGCAEGAPLILRGLDDVQAGGRAYVTGQHVDTFTYQATLAVTGSQTAAFATDLTTGLVSPSVAAGALTKTARPARLTRLSTVSKAVNELDDALRVGRTSSALADSATLADNIVAPRSVAVADDLLPILNREFTPNGTVAELITQQANRRGFATARDQAVFWSGLGRNGVARSRQFARVNGGTTLEMTRGGAYLDDLALFGPNSPVTIPEAMQIWSNASRQFARGASGQVRTVIGPVRPSSIYRTVELPELRINPNVIGIDELPLLPRIGIGG